MTTTNLYFEYCEDSNAVRASTSEGSYEIGWDTVERSAYLITDPDILNGIRLGHGLALFHDYFKSVEHVLIEPDPVKRQALLEGAALVRDTDDQGLSLRQILPEITE